MQKFEHDAHELHMVLEPGAQGADPRGIEGNQKMKYMNDNYRFYDGNWSGETEDIYADSLADAIQQGSDWIESGYRRRPPVHPDHFAYCEPLHLACEFGSVKSTPPAEFPEFLPPLGHQGNARVASLASFV